MLVIVAELFLAHPRQRFNIDFPHLRFLLQIKILDLLDQFSQAHVQVLQLFPQYVIFRARPCFLVLNQKVIGDLNLPESCCRDDPPDSSSV